LKINENRIGILTFQNSDNYGALLQAYALQKTVEKLGAESEIIDYISPNKKDMYGLIKIGKGYSAKNFIASLVKLPKKISLYTSAKKFRKEYLNLTSKKYYSHADLSENQEHWDKFIVGSDQVWNYRNTRFDHAYLLSFVNDDNKKNSYAASFGVDSIEETPSEKILKFNPGISNLKGEYSKYLSSFKNISVREEVGIKIVKELIGKDTRLVLDPTLLLDKNEWIDQLDGIDSKYNNYILLYTLDNRKEIFEYAKAISDKLNRKVVLIGNKKMAKKYGFIFDNPSILGFVKLFETASFIITDSFHGCAFSINLEKQFMPFYHSGKKTYSRIDNLLKMADIQSRKTFDTDHNTDYNQLDYDKIKVAMEQYRDQSKSYIEKVIKY
jgi:hypothetical protein